MSHSDDLLVFRPFRADADSTLTALYMQAAKDKLQTLFPDKCVVAHDEVTLHVETDSLYSDTGWDTYVIGLVDNEIPAVSNARDGNVITFRA